MNINHYTIPPTKRWYDPATGDFHIEKPKGIDTIFLASRLEITVFRALLGKGFQVAKDMVIFSPSAKWKVDFCIFPKTDEQLLKLLAIKRKFGLDTNKHYLLIECKGVIHPKFVKKWKTFMGTGYENNILFISKQKFTYNRQDVIIDLYSLFDLTRSLYNDRG